MKSKFAILLFILPILFANCKKEEELKTLTSTSWKSTDSKFTLLFDENNHCKFSYFDSYNKPVNVYYEYTYEYPNLIMVTPASSGNSSFNGTVKGNNLTLLKLNIVAFTTPDINQITLIKQ